MLSSLARGVSRSCRHEPWASQGELSLCPDINIFEDAPLSMEDLHGTIPFSQHREWWDVLGLMVLGGARGGGDAEGPLEAPSPCQPRWVPPRGCSPGRTPHSCRTLLLCNPLPAPRTGRRRYRRAQVASQSLRAACHQPRFQFF